MPEVRVVPSIHDVGRERWSGCFPGELEGFDYLAAVEAAGLPGFSWRYVLVENGRHLLAAAPAFVTDYPLDTTLTGPMRWLTARVRRLLPRFLILRLGCIGSPCTETVGVGFRPGLDDSEKPLLLQALLDGFERSARAERCSLLAAKDVPETGDGLWAPVAQWMGYEAVAGMPVAHLDVDFPDLDAYLARLSPAARKDMRRKMRAFDHVRVEVRGDLHGLEQRAMELYRATLARADLRFEELTPDYFTQVLERMPGRAVCILYFVGDELLAFNLLLVDDATLLDKFFCMDDRGRAHSLYFLSWFANLRLCLERGLTRYQSGQAGYETKLRLGSQVTRTAMYFRHRNGLVNGLLRLAAPWLSEDPLPRAATS